MNWRSEHIWIELLKGSRKRGNFFWACILFLGSLGFLAVGASSYLGKNMISVLPSQQILFFPQGVVMSFYGIAGLFISSYLWCTILWNVGSGYDRFDRKEGIVCIFRWGFPGIKRRIFLQFLVRDIQSIRIQVKEGLYPRRILYMEIRGQGVIPLTRTDEKFFTPLEIEQKAAEIEQHRIQAAALCMLTHPASDSSFSCGYHSALASDDLGWPQDHLATHSCPTRLHQLSFA